MRRCATYQQTCPEIVELGLLDLECIVKVVPRLGRRGWWCCLGRILRLWFHGVIPIIARVVAVVVVVVVVGLLLLLLLLLWRTLGKALVRVIVTSSLATHREWHKL